MGGRGRGRARNNADLPENIPEQNEPVNFVYNSPRSTKPFRVLYRFNINHPKTIHNLALLLRCVRCQVIPHPNYYMTCDNCGMITCGHCAAWTERTQRERCCNPETLRVGNQRFLKVLLENCLFECENKANGCYDKIKGIDWDEHVERLCTKRDMVECRYKPCGLKIQREEVTSHLNHFHFVRQFVSVKKKAVKLDLVYSESEALRWIAMVKFEAIDYVFAAQILDGDINMWVWDVAEKKDDNLIRRMYMIKLTPITGILDGEILYKNKCHEYDKSAEDIIEELSCLSLPLKHFRKKFVTPMDTAGTSQGTTENHYNCIITNNLAPGTRKSVVEVVVMREKVEKEKDAP